MPTLNSRTGTVRSARLTSRLFARHRSTLRASGAVSVLALLIGLSACSTSYHGLPPGLPIPGTPGIVPLSNNPAAPFAVAGRTFSYGVAFNGGTAPFGCTAVNLPAGFSISPSATLLPSVGDEYCTITANLPANAATGTFQVTVTLTDSSSPPQTAMSTVGITVNGPLTAGAFQLANGVNGRAYTQNLTVPVTGGSGTAPYSCMVGGLPAFGLSNTAPVATPTQCTFTINGPATAAGMASVTVTVSDGGENQTFPDGSIMVIVPSGSSAPSGTANNLTVRTEYAFTGVPASFPDGVVGRPYGTAAGTSPQVLTTNVSGTVGNAPLAMCAVTSGAGGNPFVEAVSGMTSCALTSSANLSANGALTLMISATDTPIPDPNNGAVIVVPAKTQTVSVPLTVQSRLAVVVNPDPIPPAVIGRTYGAPAGTNLIFTATGGIGNGPNVSFSGNPPMGIICSNPPPAMNTPTVVTCNSSGLNIPVGSTTVVLTVTASDVANAATPAGNAGTDPNSVLTRTFTVNAALSFTESGLTLTGGPPTATLPNGVTGRSYAQNGGGPPAQAPLVFTVAGGTGTGTTLAAAPGGGLVCTFAAPTLTCKATTITTAGGGNITFSVTATDTANAAVPAGNIMTDTAGNTSYVINVNNALTFSENYGTTSALPDAVQGRTYGAGSNNCSPTSACANVIFTATGGLPAYTFTETGALPAPVTCPTGATLVCSSGGGNVTGAPAAYPFTVSVTDAGNAAVPALTPALMMDTNGNSNFSLLVHAGLSLTPPARLPNGLLGFAYPPQTYTSSGGTTVNDTFVLSFSTAGGTCQPTIMSGANQPPPGLVIGPVNGILNGTPTTASTVDTDYTFPVCVSDSGNFSTPGGALNTGLQMINILDRLAAASGTGTSTIEVINYGTNSYFGAVLLGGGTATPSGLAVTSSGTTLFIADTANNVIYTLDTITGNLGANVTLPTGCGAPTELATTPNALLAGHDRLYVVCTDTGGAHVEEVAVYDTTSAATLAGGAIAEIPTGAGSSPRAVAIQANNSHAFVTLNGTNSLFVIDNTLATPAKVTNAPFALAAETDQPTGIAVANVGASVYAYIGKGGFGTQATTPSTISTVSEAGNTVTVTTTAGHGLLNGQTVTISGIATAGYNGTFTVTVTGGTTFTYTDPTSGLAPDAGGGTATPNPQQGVEVVNVTSVNGGGGSAPLVTEILLNPGETPNPDDVTVDPTNSFVYVTFPGTNEFTVLTNAVSPAQIGGAPFNLPDPTMAATDTPGGVMVPPVPVGTVLAYFTATNGPAVDVLNQGTPPTADLTITGLTASSAPGRIKFIPIPQ